MQPLIDQELLLENVALEQVLAALRDRFSLVGPEEDERRLIYWDTFDWRLWKGGKTLLEEILGESRELRLCERRGAVRRRHRLDGPSQLGMADDLPPELEELASLIAMRRLLPVVRLRLQGPRLRILDGERKTVARLRVENAHARRDPQSPEHALAPRLRVEPIRGYGAEHAEVVRFLADSFRLPTSRRTLFEAALGALGRQPGDYSSKVALELAPGRSALQAACTIHRTLLGAMVANEPGMRRDLDSEFLHDFRVAVRRTRSALSQIKGVFAEDVTEHFKRQLAWLGEITGPCRDLDVYLLKIPSYQERLLAAGRELEPLISLLAAQKRRAHRRLVADLDSARYRDLLDTWHRQLDHPVAGPAADRTARELASARIWKLFRRIVKRGRAIDDQSPAASLHDVRILGKKLRYMLELFRSLYPSDVEQAIRELKRLQDNLGDFNDYEVQQQALGEYARELADQTSTLLAMGRLQGHLEAGLETERRRFGKRFERFASVANQQRYRDLFKR